MNTFRVLMKYKKSTKHTEVFMNDGVAAEISTIYIDKMAFVGTTVPQVIVVTVEESEVQP